MRRREFIRLLGCAAVALPQAATAEKAGVYRVGLLSSGPPLADTTPFGGALVRGLAQRGFVVGKNLAIELRGAEGHVDRLPELVADLAASEVDVIVAAGYPPALAAKQGTTLPIVAVFAGDPIGTGLVQSLARPGGNLTGISDVSAEVTPKRLELLKQIVPNLRRVAVLWNADDLGMTLRYRASEAGAKALGIGIQPLGVRASSDFDQAFAAMARDMPDAILMVADPLTALNRKRVFEFAAAHRLPAIYELSLFVRDGGLMSYGPDPDETFGRVAALVDRILKGATPAELPFEQPTLFPFALNLKAARSLGLEIPPSLFIHADEVIE